MNEDIASQNSVALMKKWLSCKWPLKWYVKEVVHKNTVKYVSVTLTELSWTMLLICLSTKFEQTSPEVWRWKTTESIFGMGGSNTTYNRVSKLEWKLYRNYMHINMHATVWLYRFFFVEMFSRFTQKQCQFKKSSKIVMQKLGYVIYITQVNQFVLVLNFSVNTQDRLILT